MRNFNPRGEYGARGLGWSLSEETIGFLSWKDLSYYKSLNYRKSKSEHGREQQLAAMFHSRTDTVKPSTHPESNEGKREKTGELLIVTLLDWGDITTTQGIFVNFQPRTGIC